MPLTKAWESLNRDTVRSVPDRYGIYELGDEEGTVLSVEAGPLRDELKSVLAYGDATKVRWQTTESVEQAERLVETHRDRL